MPVEKKIHASVLMCIYVSEDEVWDIVFGVRRAIPDQQNHIYYLRLSGILSITEEGNEQQNFIERQILLEGFLLIFILKKVILRILSENIELIYYASDNVGVRLLTLFSRDTFRSYSQVALGSARWWAMLLSNCVCSQCLVLKIVSCLC